MKVHYSSKRQDWETPQELFDKLDAEYHFTTDVCATKENAKCAHFYSPEDDGLSKDWTGTCWMNPPYGRGKKGIKPWLEKAYLAGLNGVIVVCLIPARTDTIWWHDYIAHAKKIEFIKGRIHFVGAEWQAPFPSAIAVFGTSENEGNRK